MPAELCHRAAAVPTGARSASVPVSWRAIRRARSRSPAPDFSRLEYDRRVNRVIDHIRAHLDEPLTLEGLARLAAFSPCHFGRVFKAMTGETLFEFVHRARIEGAARALLARPGQSVLEIALDHGFSSAAAFARAFRERFDMSATEWRAAHHRNSGTEVRNARKAGPRAGSHTSRKRAVEEPAMSIRVTELPPYHVAYMRYVDPYGAHGIPELWGRFGKWMDAHGSAGAGRITIGVGYDDPRITAAEKCRYDACAVVAPDFRPDQLVDVTDLAGGPTRSGVRRHGARDRRRVGPGVQRVAARQRLGARRPSVPRGLSRRARRRPPARRVSLRPLPAGAAPVSSDRALRNGARSPQGRTTRS